MAMGVIQAVITSGKLGEIYVCGTDGDKDAVESVKNGELTATVAQDPANIGITVTANSAWLGAAGEQICPGRKTVQYGTC